MPIINRNRYPENVFFAEQDFLEIGICSNGAKIIQIGAEGDAPLVAFTYTTNPCEEDLHALELWSLSKFSQDPNEFNFYQRPRAISQSASFPIKVNRAFYIKLGKGGQWEESSISEGIARIGWRSVPIQLIDKNDWQAIEQVIRTGASNRADLNALRTFCEATSDDIWITFHASRLWWCRLADEPVAEDSISKFRRVGMAWRDTNALGKKLFISEIPGQLSKVQGYRATLCKISEVSVLERLLNGQASEAYQQCQMARDMLEGALVSAIQQLHWKDFETLVDLIFRQAGWRRVSVLGETMKFADLELEEPITGDRYQVQIKSKASMAELMSYVEKFPKGEFRQFYFVVHSPDQVLESVDLSSTPFVKLVLPPHLAKMIIDSGLTQWLINKIR